VVGPAADVWRPAGQEVTREIAEKRDH
jgi:hypothetical protein